MRRYQYYLGRRADAERNLRWAEAEPLALRVLAIQGRLQDTLARVGPGSSSPYIVAIHK